VSSADRVTVAPDPTNRDILCRPVVHNIGARESWTFDYNRVDLGGGLAAVARAYYSSLRARPRPPVNVIVPSLV
jgi:hypothetical protein